MAAAYGLPGRLRKAVALPAPMLPAPMLPAPVLPAWMLLASVLLASMLLVLPAVARPVHLLVLGDSLTSGHNLAHTEGFQAQLVAALAKRGHQVRIIDGAVSGDTTADGRARLAWALGDGADAAIVELGANDGLRGIDPEVMQANLTAILDTLAARHIPVLLCGMYAPPNMGPDYERDFKAVFEHLSQRPGVLFDAFFLEGIAEDPRYTLPDREHPNPAGVRLIVARLLPLVVKLVDEVTSE